MAPGRDDDKIHADPNVTSDGRTERHLLHHISTRPAGGLKTTAAAPSSGELKNVMTIDMPTFDEALDLDGECTDDCDCATEML